MPFLGPIPQVAVNLVVYGLEGAARDDVPVKVGPTPNYRVEGPDQITGFPGREFPDAFPDLGQKRCDIVSGRFDEQLPLVLARVLPQEIESVLNPRDPGFLRGQGQTPFQEKLFYRRFDRRFEKFLRLPGNDEVIGVADDVDLGPARGSGFDRRLQSVQGHISQNWGNYAPCGVPVLVG